MLDMNFTIVDSVHELAHLGNLLVDDEILSAWEFQAKGTAAGSDGVRITLDKYLQVTQPVPTPRRKEMDGEVSEEDGELVLVGSDVECKDGG